MLIRAKTDSALKKWGMAPWEKIGFKRANVMVARKLAVTLFAMLYTGKLFEADARPRKLPLPRTGGQTTDVQESRKPKTSPTLAPLRRRNA
ncbi:hypothetical protein LY56_02677 [Roseinatronobacter thiooxidans]|uniref:Transposase IS116/IS110/IS902 family protein n=1 Tax=Roseinatronobacter thiooxidans TaxID=121821 RepID=A0A2W7QE91_9RHOB|nr:hypothetical protein [Roseinatronobacter thiooxidans]PZX39509.1 hypothetical protein LY56_02677 [Roseinatronobacter thiooxidans]